MSDSGPRRIPVPAHIEALEAYRPGRPIADVLKEHGLEEAIKLASNENPLGASPLAVKAMHEAMDHVAYYPNGGRTLREALAAYYGLSVDEVIVGSGSEGVMNTLMRAYLSHGDEVLTSEGTFAGFYVLAQAMGLKLKLVPLKDCAYDLHALANAITPWTKMIYLANPNNPTGSYFTNDELEKLYSRIPSSCIVIHDEAYYDFAIDDVDNYPTTINRRLPNVVTLRTFSKSHGLAGVRIGFGVAPEEIIHTMLKVKLPFEPSELAQAAGLGALQDEAFLSETIRVNKIGKQYLKDAFDDLGLKYVPTAGNFFCVELPSASDAEFVTKALEQRGIIVRPLAWFGLPNCIRISIGTPSQNEKAVQALTQVLEDVLVANEPHT